jgi:sortase (surface protein transpeptidase)
LVLGSAVAGLLLIFLALGHPSVSRPAPVASPESSGSRTDSRATPRATAQQTTARVSSTSPKAERRIIRDRISGPHLPESDPLSVAIPRIAVRSPLVRLGLDVRGELEVPQNPARAGWFTEGATPGALGPAVIAGHVTWNGTPAVFYRLGRLRPGDRVTVDRRDGRTAVFTVTRVSQFPKTRFPTKAVYGPIDHAGLRLITCGGTYDSARHRYLDNVVVFASLSAVRSG